MTEQQPAATPDPWIRRDHLYLAIIVGLLLGTGPAGLPIWAFAVLGGVCAVAAWCVRVTEPRRDPARIDTVMLALTFLGGGIGGTLGVGAGGAAGGATAGVLTALLGVVAATGAHHWLRQRRPDS